MNLKSLSTASMLVVAKRWLVGDSRRVIDGLVLCSALLPKLEEAHERLLATQPKEGEADKALKVVRAEAVGADGLFDTRGRGLFRGLQALEDLSEDAGEKAAFAEVREAIFPKGLSVLALSYLQEVGEARLAAKRLNGEQRRRLDGVRIGEWTAGEVFDRWLAAAEQLDQKLIERDKAETRLQGASDGVTSGEAYEARLAWVRVVQAFVTNLDLEPVDADTRALLLKTLHSEVERVQEPAPKVGGVTGEVAGGVAASAASGEAAESGGLASELPENTP